MAPVPLSIKVADYAEGTLAERAGAASAGVPQPYGKTKTKICKLLFGDDRKLVIKGADVTLVRSQKNIMYLKPTERLSQLVVDVEEAVVALTCASIGAWFPDKKDLDASALAELFQPSIVFDKRNGSALRLNLVNSLGTDDLQPGADYVMILVPYCIRFASAAFHVLWQVQAELLAPQPAPVSLIDDADHDAVVGGAAEDIQESVPHEDLVVVAEALSRRAREVMDGCAEAARVLQARHDLAAGIFEGLARGPSMRSVVEAEQKMQELMALFETGE